MECKVMYHDRCFDGACSAALFTRFRRECAGAIGVGAPERFVYQGMVHRADGLYDPSWFLAEGENAIVDFKYSASERLTWWFDHHQSAFSTAEDRAKFEAEQKDGSHSQRHFFDPAYVSCTGWIAEIASTRFGMDVAPLQELIYWANIVDGARYESAQVAVEMREPALQITLIIESAESSELVQQFIPLLTEMPLGQIVQQPFVADRLGPLLERHRANIELIGARSQVQRGVIEFDLTDQPTEGYSKFIPYYLQPEATYVVGLSRSSFRTKISVGTNPWTPKPAGELANIAEICERYGGGGHARVGAISFPVDQLEAARKAAAVIAAELRARP